MGVIPARDEFFRAELADRLEISGPETAQKLGMAGPKLGVFTEVHEPERF